MRTKDIIKDLKNLEDVFDLKNLDKTHEIFSKKIKNVIGEIETPNYIIMEEFVCFSSEA